MNDFSGMFADSIGYGFGIGAIYYIFLYAVVKIFAWIKRS